MALAGKNVLITGGTGFIGSHLAENLESKGSHIFVTYESIIPRSYFKSTKLHDKSTLVVCDLKNFRRVFDIVTKFEIDYIFHLGAQPLVTVAYSNPLESLQTNIMGTVNVLEAARLYGKVDGIVVASSDKAYGKIPRAHENKPLGGDHPYEVSKSSADLIAFSYYKTYGLPVVVTRFGNVYGEGDLNFSRIVPGALKAILNDGVLEIRSNGKYIRDYVYVKDVVNATILLAEKVSRVKGEAFNISSFENLSVLELIKNIGKILDKQVLVKILDSVVNEIPVQSISFNKIKTTLGWKPANSLKSTIPQIYKWYQWYFDKDKAFSQ